MKKFSLLTFCILMSFFSKAQIALATDENIPIADGQVFTYNTTDENIATLHYKIKNTSANAIKVRMKIMSIQNATGNNFQFCYLSTCLPSVSVNAVYPSNASSPIAIAANSETPSVGYNMWNSNAGSGIFPISYVIKYYLVNNANTEYGTPVTITYKYDPNAILGVNDVKNNQNSFAEIQTNVVKDNIEVISKENASYNLNSMDGRILSSGNLKNGKNSLDISTLNTGIYIMTLKNSQGKIITKKIIKTD
ncbi:MULTISPECIES: T9SS type A sorting domain-containing protein [Chryseobacterium]|uniref:Secretion system C-terminal sorting domain-containing protein n=1 Tax=Chryseobacterium geocarposphaerae TaxID=1416776 RepID=A0ABU1L9A1_9FLAO|nr:MULTISPECIES: T9SS type A sorting domain-containing protein [Chryseobacterium]MDR6403155.1 hypothetical protein [Chryseobacterium geocarposphaerae]MDR6696710.1 hypothetical protein [Chryseobacterium ginsenosidimutans]